MRITFPTCFSENWCRKRLNSLSMMLSLNHLIHCSLLYCLMLLEFVITCLNLRVGMEPSRLGSCALSDVKFWLHSVLSCVCLELALCVSRSKISKLCESRRWCKHLFDCPLSYYATINKIIIIWLIWAYKFFLWYLHYKPTPILFLI